MFQGIEDNVIDIEPLNPVTKGHRIIIPRYHSPDFTENEQAMVIAMQRARVVARLMGGSVNLITSKGIHATQTVGHLHVHIVPRREGDGLCLPWTGQEKTPDESGA